jgi:hypothetical protein
MGPVAGGPVRHRVRVTTVGAFLRDYLGRDPRDGMSPVDWLVVPPQRLRTVAEGRVFHDGTGELEDARAGLR